MSRRVFCRLIGIFTLSLLAACGPKDSASKATPLARAPGDSDDAPAKVNQEGPSFDAKGGLYLPEATRQSMGITTVAVQKRTFQAERTMKFQVFREADEQPLPGMPYRSGQAYASTMVTDEKIELEPGQVGKVVEPRDGQARLFQVNALPALNQAEVLVEMADPKHQFVLGEFCAVRWRMAAVDAPAAAPDSALLKTTEGDFVYLQKEDRFIRTEVKLGATGEGFTAITGGVAVGDRVVTNPVQTLWLTELKLKTGGGEP